MGKKIVTDEGVSLYEVVNGVDKKRQKKMKRDAKYEEMFDRPPMRGTATVCTAASLVATGFAVSGTGGMATTVVGTLISMAGFLGTMMAKGNRDSKYCVVLAVINLITATTLVVLELKARGIFDWIETTIKF